MGYAAKTITEARRPADCDGYPAQRAENYSVDKNKIYITGYSMGGFGVYGAVSRYHGVFAAAVPTDSVWDPARSVEMDNIPMWVFQWKT